MLEADDERQSLMRRMQRLDERERSILALRFGLEGELPLTLKEVGRRLGVTREWVRKIEIRAVRKLDDSESSGDDNDRTRRGPEFGPESRTRREPSTPEATPPAKAGAVVAIGMLTHPSPSLLQPVPASLATSHVVAAVGGRFVHLRRR